VSSIGSYPTRRTRVPQTIPRKDPVFPSEVVPVSTHP
jgi:hypothetical protein